METTLLLAGLRVCFVTRTDCLNRRGRAYLAAAGGAPDLTLSVTEPEIEAARTAPDGARLPFSEGESFALYRKLAEVLPRFDAFVFHAAAVETEGVGYAFAGRSGVGKSTHSRLWQTCFSASFINGDKPVFRLTDGRFYVCGTPWAGKEPGQNAPVMRPLGGLCFLRQGKEDVIHPLPPEKAALLLLEQTILPPDEKDAARQMELLDRLARSVPLYEMACTVSKKAAVLSYTAMTGHAPAAPRAH